MKATILRDWVWVGRLEIEMECRGEMRLLGRVADRLEALSGYAENGERISYTRSSDYYTTSSTLIESACRSRLLLAVCRLIVST